MRSLRLRFTSTKPTQIPVGLRRMTTRAARQAERDDQRRAAPRTRTNRAIVVGAVDRAGARTFRGILRVRVFLIGGITLPLLIAQNRFEGHAAPIDADGPVARSDSVIPLDLLTAGSDSPGAALGETRLRTKSSVTLDRTNARTVRGSSRAAGARGLPLPDATLA